VDKVRTGAQLSRSYPGAGSVPQIHTSRPDLAPLGERVRCVGACAHLEAVAIQFNVIIVPDLRRAANIALPRSPSRRDSRSVSDHIIYLKPWAINRSAFSLALSRHYTQWWFGPLNRGIILRVAFARALVAKCSNTFRSTLFPEQVSQTIKTRTDRIVIRDSRVTVPHLSMPGSFQSKMRRKSHTLGLTGTDPALH
jgi:hypothetical protein